MAKRWDSLRLFNPARYAGLPGLRFPARGDTFPTKDQMADYLGDYVKKFHLPVQSSVKIDRLWREGDRFLMTAGSRRFEIRKRGGGDGKLLTAKDTRLRSLVGP